jgi:hypothetical protein
MSHFTKLSLSFTDVLKATNWTFQEVDDIVRLAGGSAVYGEFFFCGCASTKMSKLFVYQCVM